MDHLRIATPPDPRTIVSRWNQQYGHYYGTPDGAKWEAVRDKLAKLTPPTSPDIEAIIGNDSWTTLTCSGCYGHVIRAISVNDETVVCAACLRASLDMLGER